MFWWQSKRALSPGSQTFQEQPKLTLLLPCHVWAMTKTELFTSGLLLSQHMRHNELCHSSFQTHLLANRKARVKINYFQKVDREVIEIMVSTDGTEGFCSCPVFAEAKHKHFKRSTAAGSMTVDTDPLLSFLAELTVKIQRNINSLYSSVRKLSEAMYIWTHTCTQREWSGTITGLKGRLQEKLENKHYSKSVHFFWTALETVAGKLISVVYHQRL